MSQPMTVPISTVDRSDALPTAGAEQPLGLTTVTPEHAAAVSLIHRRRQPWRTQLIGRVATIAAVPGPAADETADRNRYLVRIGIDGRACALSLPAPVLSLALAQVDPSLRAGGLSPAHAALALELALSDALDALEASWNCRLSLLSVAPAAAGAMPGEHPPLDVTVDIDGLGPSSCALLAGPTDITRLARQLDRAAGIDQAAVDDTPLPVCLRVAASSPTIGELASVACGDVILVDDVCRDGAQAVLVIAEHLVAPVDLDPAGARLSVRPLRGRGSAWEWSMDKSADVTGEIGDADLADIPVRVVFEVGRVELALGDVRRLAPGALIPMARSPEHAVDIVAHGRRIGRGSLIRIGDSLGVRITRMFDHG